MRELKGRPILDSVRMGELENLLRQVVEAYGDIPPGLHENVVQDFASAMHAWTGPSWFRLLVTGPRVMKDRERVWRDLDKIYATQGPLVVVEGGCATGADLFARQWVEEAKRQGRHVEGETHDAPWDLLSHSAGGYRNAWMCAQDINGVLAYLLPGSPGSWKCALFAEHYADLPMWKRRLRKEAA